MREKHTDKNNDKLQIIVTEREFSHTQERFGRAIVQVCGCICVGFSFRSCRHTW